MCCDFHKKKIVYVYGNKQPFKCVCPSNLRAGEEWQLSEKLSKLCMPLFSPILPSSPFFPLHTNVQLEKEWEQKWKLCPSLPRAALILPFPFFFTWQLFFLLFSGCILYLVFRWAFPILVCLPFIRFHFTNKKKKRERESCKANSFSSSSLTFRTRKKQENSNSVHRIRKKRKEAAIGERVSETSRHKTWMRFSPFIYVCVLSLLLFVVWSGQAERKQKKKMYLIKKKQTEKKNKEQVSF